MTPEFLLTSLIIVLAPGTGVIYTLAVALGQGSRAGVYAAVGCTLGIVPHIAASILGLAAIVHTSALAFQVLKYLGVAYLLYLAWCAWREGGAVSLEGAVPKGGMFRILRRAVAVNLLNPKLSIFFVAFLPQFILPTAPVAPQLLLLGGTFVGLAVVVCALYAILAGSLREAVAKPSLLTAIHRAGGGILIGAGLMMALVRRST